MKKLLIITLTISLLTSCSEKGLQTLNDVLTTTDEIIREDGPSPLTNDEVVKGLKEALKVGTETAVNLTSKADGFYKSPELFIQFPEEAIKVKNTLNDAGFGHLVEKFEMTLNRSAEEAAKFAAPIFVDAITQMTIQDGFTILKGSDNAATNYLRDKTTEQLNTKFRPTVQQAIEKVDLTKYWEPVINKALV